MTTKNFHTGTNRQWTPMYNSTLTISSIWAETAGTLNTEVLKQTGKVRNKD